MGIRAERLRSFSIPFALSLLAAGCRDDPVDAGSSGDSGVKEIRIERPDRHFVTEGFVQMVPPIRLPLRSERNRVEVWLRIPEAGRIETVDSPNGPTLELPSGSEAARVERYAHGGPPAEWVWSIADVRGTRFLETGERFYVLRPDSTRVDASLRGFSWDRGDAEQQRKATNRVVELVGAIANPRFREQQRAAARKNNDCVSCHEHARPANHRPREHGIANRSTDASGCYQVQNVLVSRVPLETYFSIQANLDDPFIEHDCGVDVPAVVDRKARTVTCSTGTIPWGRLDVRAALEAGDDRARKLCAARKYLRDRLDPAGLRVFREGFDECGLAH